MRLKREALYALVLVAFLWVSLFGDWLPIPVQSVLFVTVLLLGLVMIVAGWWGWIKSRQKDVPRWQKRVGLAGATANTALAIPLGSLLYRMHYPFLRVGVHGLSMVNAERIVLTSLALSLSALIAGILAPPRCRFAITLGGLIFGSAVLSIPVGFV